MHPQPRVRNETKHTSVVTTGSPGLPRLPCAMVLTAYTALSPGTGLSCPRRLRKLASANLTPASGYQDHAPSPSAGPAPLSKARPASIASRRNVRDDAQRPSLSRRDGEHVHLICISEKQKYFSRKGWTKGRIGHRQCGPSGKSPAQVRHREERMRRSDPRTSDNMDRPPGCESSGGRICIDKCLYKY